MRLLLLFAGLAACSGPRPARPCSDDRECRPTEMCSSGACLARPQSCGSNMPCPDGQECCGGLCTTAQCCSADIECGAGWCDGGRCTDGPRPSCSAGTPCATGRCLLSAGRCVECIHQEDCGSGYSCSPSLTCVRATAGCTPGSCAQSGLVCAPEEGTCRGCLSSAECGDLVCRSGLCTGCVPNEDCGAGRACENGRCVTETGTTCATDADCGDRVCRFDSGALRCVDCVAGDCGAGRTCGALGRCTANNPECSSDTECSPPDSICQAGLCASGCARGGCAEGQSCNAQTGRCVVTSGGTTPMGAACTAHSQCASGLCYPVNLGGTPDLRCSRTCTKHDTCPTDFICYELGDANLCYPKSVFGSAPWSEPPGSSCSQDSECKSGYCGDIGGTPAKVECLEMCGRDGDCAAGLACLCDIPLLDGVLVEQYTQLCAEPWGPTAGGGACTNDDDCSSGWCVQTPDDSAGLRCAQPCCSPADCGPPYSVCKPIFVYDGTWDDNEPFTFQKTCLWREYDGQKNAGEPCSADSECKSEICAAGPSGVRRCTQTCCTNDDCAAFGWSSGCRPPFRGDHAVPDANFMEVVRSLGRRRSNGLPSDAISPVCMPL